MKRQTVSVVILCCLVVGAVTGFGGHYFGREAGVNHGEKIGYDKGYQAARPSSRQLYAEQNYDTLVDDYNKLVKDYNSLREAAIKYVNANSYQSRSPITCNTRNYSSLSSSTTTCY